MINFILGQAKLAAYMSRKNRVAQAADSDVVRTFSRLVKSRILIDFNYCKCMSDLETFKVVWCCGEALCSVLDNELCFAPHFND